MKIIYPKQRFQNLLMADFPSDMPPRDPSVAHFITKRGCAGVVNTSSFNVWGGDYADEWECRYSYPWECESCPAFDPPERKEHRLNFLKKALEKSNG